MTDVLTTVLDDLSAEGDALEALVADLDEDGWRTPTPAAGWDVATQISHLAWTDEVAVKAATDKDAWDAVVLLAIADPTGFVDTEALAGGAAAPAALLGRWSAGRLSLRSALAAYDGGRMPWFGPPMSPTSMATARLMETWAHGLDVREALGVAPEPSNRDPAHRAPRRTHPRLRLRHPLADAAGRGVPDRPRRAGRRHVGVRARGRGADGHRLGARPVPARHAADQPRRHRPRRDRTPTRTGGSTSRSASRVRPGRDGRRHERRAAHRQLLGLLRRPVERHARDARGWTARRADRRLPRRADDADPGQGHDEGPVARLRADVCATGRGLPRAGARTWSPDRQQRGWAEPRRARRASWTRSPPVSAWRRGSPMSPATTSVRSGCGRAR